MRAIRGQNGPNQAEVHWLGQSATKITSLGGKVIMIDPFSDAGPGLGAARQGRALRQGGTVTPVGPQIKITQTHAEHTSEIAVIDPVTKKSTTYPPGEPTGFLIELENGFKIYHMGDTRLFGDMKLIGEYYKPDLIMIHHADAA